jgi:hypothetical protein
VSSGPQTFRECRNSLPPNDGIILNAAAFWAEQKPALSLPKAKLNAAAHSRLRPSIDGIRQGTFSPVAPYLNQEDVMRAYLSKLSPATRILLAVPLIAIAYSIVMIVIPAAIHAAVPNVVRSVLRLM